MNNLTIALDVMSCDHGSVVAIDAAIDALKAHSDLFIIFVGKKDQIIKYLPKNTQRFEIVESSSVITNDMKLSHAIRNSHGSSMRIMLELVRDNFAAACVSAGNTGALMGLSKLLLSSIPGIDRPALLAAIPTINNEKTLMLDLGANVECNSDMLVQFALMGSILAQSVFDVKNPRVALLNIGEEDLKGADRIRYAAEILKNNEDFNFIGYVEGNDLLLGKTDVLVCDGFSGNIALKTLEGVMNVLLHSNFIKSNSFVSKLKRLYFKKCINQAIGHLDPSYYNGACLLGLNSVVIKSHGNASKTSFLSAIEQAIMAVKNNIPQRIASSLSSLSKGTSE